MNKEKDNGRDRFLSENGSSPVHSSRVGLRADLNSSGISLKAGTEGRPTWWGGFRRGDIEHYRNMSDHPPLYPLPSREGR